eukprot:599767-Hanusia_phi.AAC.1
MPCQVNFPARAGKPGPRAASWHRAVASVTLNVTLLLEWPFMASLRAGEEGRRGEARRGAERWSGEEDEEKHRCIFEMREKRK